MSVDQKLNFGRNMNRFAEQKFNEAFQAAGKHLGHFCRLSIFGVSPNGGALVLGTSQCRFDSYHPDLVNVEQDYIYETYLAYSLSPNAVVA